MWSYDDVEKDLETGERVTFEEYEAIKHYVITGSMSESAKKCLITREEVKEIIDKFKVLCPEQYERMSSMLRIIGTKKDPVENKVKSFSDMEIFEWLNDVDQEKQKPFKYLDGLKNE